MYSSIFINFSYMYSSIFISVTTQKDVTICYPLHCLWLHIFQLKGKMMWGYLMWLVGRSRRRRGRSSWVISRVGQRYSGADIYRLGGQELELEQGIKVQQHTTDLHQQLQHQHQYRLSILQSSFRWWKNCARKAVLNHNNCT